MTFAERLREVRDRVAAACARANRRPDEVELIAVSKRHPSERIREACAAGVRSFGENFAQELVGKADDLADIADIRWHFIGRLQRNKVKQIIGRVALVHAVDSEALALAIERRAQAVDVVQPVLLAVNVAGEDSKSGVAPDAVAALLAAVERLAHVEVTGLMTMPPLAECGEDNRCHFAALRAVRDRYATAERPLADLSMGTTADYEVAIEEGATLVRVGTALFGPRG